GYSCAGGGSFHCPFLVADGPGDDGRMVTVAKDHPAQRVGHLRGDEHPTVLVDHEDAQAVAGIEQFGRGRVMCAAVGICADGFQTAEAVAPEFVGYGCAHSCMVLVVVGPLELDVDAVQEEACIRVPADSAAAKSGGAGIHCCVAVEDGRC